MNDKTSEWIGYEIKISERITDINNGQALNPDAIEFVPKKPLSSFPFNTGDNTDLDIQADTDLLSHGEHESTCPLIDQPTRRRARIAKRKAKQNMTKDGQTTDTTQGTRQPSLTSLNGIRDQDSTVDQPDNKTDKQINTEESNEIQPNQDDQTANDILTTWAVTITTDSKKTNDERTTEKNNENDEQSRHYSG